MSRGAFLKAKWADPVWREAQLARLRSPEVQERRLRALMVNKAQAANQARSKVAKVKNNQLRKELAHARAMNARMAAELQRIHVIGAAQDRRRGAEQRAASTRGVATILTDEEHTLLRMACLSLDMTSRQFIREALVFYAAWAVDHARTFNSPSLTAREGIGLRADIETDIKAWRAAAE